MGNLLLWRRYFSLWVNSMLRNTWAASSYYYYYLRQKQSFWGGIIFASVCLSVCPSVCPSVCLSVCLSNGLKSVRITKCYKTRSLRYVLKLTHAKFHANLRSGCWDMTENEAFWPIFGPYLSNRTSEWTEIWNLSMIYHANKIICYSLNWFGHSKHDFTSDVAHFFVHISAPWPPICVKFEIWGGFCMAIKFYFLHFFVRNL